MWMKFNASDGVGLRMGIKTVFKFNASDGVGYGGGIKTVFKFSASVTAREWGDHSG